VGTEKNALLYQCLEKLQKEIRLKTLPIEDDLPGETVEFFLVIWSNFLIGIAFPATLISRP
jgi:hypothetical protein